MRENINHTKLLDYYVIIVYFYISHLRLILWAPDADIVLSFPPRDYIRPHPLIDVGDTRRCHSKELDVLLPCLFHLLARG